MTTRRGNTPGGPNGRQAWVRAFADLLEDGSWLGAVPRPSGQDGLIKALADRLTEIKAGLAEPEKAIKGWLEGRIPFAKSFEPLCQIFFVKGRDGPLDEENFRALWGEARKSPREFVLDRSKQPERGSDVPDTMGGLIWTVDHPWQSTGLAELIADRRETMNNREAYKLMVTVSFGTSRIPIGKRVFLARLREARLTPEYANCHPEPGSRPGEAGRHDHIAIAGGEFHFRGPKPDGLYLFGNPFISEVAPDGATDDGDDEKTSLLLPFAIIAWDKPGATSVKLTLASEKNQLDIMPEDDPRNPLKPLTKAREKVIQTYLRECQARQQGGTIDWAQAIVRGRKKK